MKIASKATNKLPYESPKLYKVVLNHEQAILSGCSTSCTRPNNTTGAGCRRNCRAGSNTSGVDSAATS